MADLSDNALNVMLTALRGVAVFASLHTADPTNVGDHEVAGGSPAYARKAVTWGAPSAGAMDTSATHQFDVPAGTTVTHWGLWSAASAGTFYGSGTLAVPESFGGQGKITMLTGTTALG